MLPILPSLSAAASNHENNTASAVKKLAGIQESRRESDATLEAIIPRRLDFADDADDERSYFNGSPSAAAAAPGVNRVTKMEQTLKSSYRISGEHKM